VLIVDALNTTWDDRVMNPTSEGEFSALMMLLKKKEATVCCTPKRRFLGVMGRMNVLDGCLHAIEVLISRFVSGIC
jgi:hypothetical protein